MIYTLLAIIGGASLLCVGVLLAGLCLAASCPEPKPNYSKAQVLWMRHTAKVAHRRAS